MRTAAAEDEWFGEPHTLIVDVVRPPEGILDDGDLDRYHIQHPPACKLWACDVGWYEHAAGLAASLRYSGTPITVPGTYLVRAWGTKTRTVAGDGYLFDGGIGVIPPGEAV